ncbi:MAG: SRPBCC domain-containing protein [Bacteroidetes bacterium]|nr:SRPBCC domain-containing protein [Bacteroidota bacterium]
MWITIIILFTLLIVLSRASFEIRDEIEINASIDKVWSEIIDFKSYKNWNTQLTFLGGEVKPGGKLHLKLSTDGAAPYEFKPAISHWEERKQFAWIAITGIPRVFDGEHFFELRDLGNERTLLVNREEYRGILSLIFKELPMMKNAPSGFKKMNLEFKSYVENNG